MKLKGENRITRRKSCSSATLSTTNPTWTDPGSNPGLRGERPATNRLSHGTAHSSCSKRCQEYSTNIILFFKNKNRHDVARTQQFPHRKLNSRPCYADYSVSIWLGLFRKYVKMQQMFESKLVFDNLPVSVFPQL
jgi:hypothetical protein